MKRHKPYRERYFEDYQAIKKWANNKKGYTVEYRYIGLWNAWAGGKWSLGTLKRGFAVAELISVAVYLLAASRPTGLTTVQLCNGFGIVSVVSWLAEIIGVVCFIASGPYVKELSCSEIDKCLRYGCSIRTVLVVLSVICGFLGVLMSGSLSPLDLMAALGILLSAGISLGVRLIYGTLSIETYRNHDGEVGAKY